MREQKTWVHAFAQCAAPHSWYSCVLRHCTTLVGVYVKHLFVMLNAYRMIYFDDEFFFAIK